jgi:hypothetical protein
MMKFEFFWSRITGSKPKWWRKLVFAKSREVALAKLEKHLRGIDSTLSSISVDHLFYETVEATGETWSRTLFEKCATYPLWYAGSTRALEFLPDSRPNEQQLNKPCK